MFLQKVCYEHNTFGVTRNVVSFQQYKRHVKSENWHFAIKYSHTALLSAHKFITATCPDGQNKFKIFKE